jgi:hypothetical protein
MIRFLLALFVALAVMTDGWAADGAGQGASESSESSESSAPANYKDTDVLSLPGVAMDLVVTRDTDKFERNIARVGAMVQYESPYDFIAIGASSNEFRQGDWSTRVNSLEAVVRKVNRGTAEGVTARAALAVKGGQTEFHGEGGWNIRFSQRTGVELIANRDAVETVQAFTNNIMANFFAVSLDHELIERLTVIGMPTYRSFSDGNDQIGLRGWIIYGLIPEYGLSINLKVRGYESSQNGGGAYFSPERYERAEIGVRLRKAFGDWRVFATADVGRERINRDIEKPTFGLALTTQRIFANSVSLGLHFSYYRASETTNATDTSGDYAWQMARIVLSVPF